MILALLIIAATPPPPAQPMQRVTICSADGGDCKGINGTALTDTQLRATPVPVSGSLACTGPLTDDQLRAEAVPVSGDFFQATQPVSLASVPSHAVTGPITNTEIRAAPVSVFIDGGTIACTLVSVPTHAVTGPLTDAQLRNSAVPVSLATAPTTPVTGTFWQATQPVSLASAPTTPVTGTFWQATQPVSGTFWQATQPVSGTVTANAGTGTMAVSGPVTDAQLRASAVPVSGPATDAQMRATPLNVTEGTSTRWSCFVQAVTATTQCQAAPAVGLRLYVTSVACSNGAATVQTLDVVFGTGSNCVTGTTALTHKFQMGTNATTTSPLLVSLEFNTPLVPTAANAICVRPSAATAFGCTLTGYTGT